MLAVTSGSWPALAQGTSDRTVEEYTCKEIIRESGPNRDTAIAFLHGFLLGKSDSSKINIETLTKQTDAFIDKCLDNPNEKAMAVMLKIKG
jgi:hypothetical protein